jgi:DNA/RNA endonuclease YhcR with UshA esterase domain
MDRAPRTPDQYLWGIHFFVVFLVCTLLVIEVVYATTLTAIQAKEHIGETATVCGVVASATYADRTKGSPTFINLDQPYPQHVFTAVIWWSDRSKFSQTEITYKSKRVCVTGTIKSYRDRPEIIVKEPSQITIEHASK